MVKRELPAERHYILPVCNMTCLNLCQFLRCPLRRREFLRWSRAPPLKYFFNFNFLLFNYVYAHNSNISYKNILILKKIGLRAFQGAEPL